MAYTTIDDPSVYFQIGLYTGNGNDDKAINLGSANFTGEYVGQNIQPDLVWIKQRSGATRNHNLTDSTRGVTKHLSSDLNEAEATASNRFKSFDSNGFTLGDSGYTNDADDPFVAWVWKANGGTTSSNTDGSITSTVQANTTAGFSIVTYTGTGSNGTVAHGLGSAPKMIFIKDRDNNSTNWGVYNESAGNNGRLQLNTTGSFGTSSTYWQDTSPTSSVFSLGTWVRVNDSGANFIAYCFAEKQGYSKIGSYTGNGNADGPFIYTGFKPAWILVKRTDSTNGWFLMDNKRSPFNLTNDFLRPNASDVEGEAANSVWDMLSNGFKIRGTGADVNASGSPFIYIAFAEHPFVSSEGVPTTAR